MDVMVELSCLCTCRFGRNRRTEPHNLFFRVGGRLPPFYRRTLDVSTSLDGSAQSVGCDANCGNWGNSSGEPYIPHTKRLQPVHAPRRAPAPRPPVSRWPRLDPPTDPLWAGKVEGKADRSKQHIASGGQWFGGLYAQYIA